MLKRFSIFIVIFLIGTAPIISVAISGSIASSHGCTLNESQAHPCIVDGKDIGKDLYTYAMLGWFSIATIPIALALYVVWILVEIILYFIRRKKRKDISNSDPQTT